MSDAMTLFWPFRSLALFLAIAAALCGCMRTGGTHHAGDVLEGRVETRPAGDGSRNGTPQRRPVEALALAEEGGAATPVNYLDMPNLVGVGAGPGRRALPAGTATAYRAAPADSGPAAADSNPPYQPERRFAAAAAAEAETGAGRDTAKGKGGRYYIPPEGIDIDAALGVGAPAAAPAGPISAQEAMDGPAATPIQAQGQPGKHGSRLKIAEQNPSQTVVDGIGTDAPVALVTPGRP